MTAPSWSLRQRARVAYGLLGVVVVVGFAVAAVIFNQFVDARHRFADRIDPSALATERWLSALVDQETGVRGFALTANDAFLQPYRSGRSRAAAAESEIRADLDEPDVMSEVTAMARAAAQWRTTSITPLIARTRRSGAATLTPAELDRSKAQFDVVRQRYGELAATIDRIRTRARQDLDNRVGMLAITAGAALILVIAGLAATWLFLKQLVLRPLERLGEGARRVADGALDHQVATSGPPEIDALASDIEAMRSRILTELAVVNEARELLEEQAADLARSNQELEQFAYVASHDLQEPLRKITGFCQLLQRRYEGQIDERADEYIGYAVDGAKRMQVLINDLLAFSQVGRNTEAFEPVDLTQVANDAVSSLDAVIADAGAVVTIGALPTVPGDATLLEALIMNLVANAVKFRGEEAPRVELSSRSLDDGTGCELTCADNGIGIEAEYAARIFVIFQRLHGREAYEGTGIGLAMSRKIVEFHGGQIWVDPAAPGPGATIRWTLPHSAATIAGTAAPSPPAPTTTGVAP